MTTMSHNNPYGVDQFPEWVLWEQAATARNEAIGYENEARARSNAAKHRNQTATEIEAALSKLRPPSAPKVGRLMAVGPDFPYDDRS